MCARVSQVTSLSSYDHTGSFLRKKKYSWFWRPMLLVLSLRFQASLVPGARQEASTFNTELLRAERASSLTWAFLKTQIHTGTRNTRLYPGHPLTMYIWGLKLHTSIVRLSYASYLFLPCYLLLHRIHEITLYHVILNLTILMLQVYVYSWSREGLIATKLEPSAGVVTQNSLTWGDLLPGHRYKVEVYPKLKRTGAFTTVPRWRALF
jgi:hypothetical protein